MARKTEIERYIYIYIYRLKFYGRRTKVLDLKTFLAAKKL